MLFKSTLAAILAGGIFWSCQKSEMQLVPEEGISLKGAVIEYTPNCSATYELISNRNIPVGKLLVSNDNTFLRVEYIASGSNVVSEVHLWVGTSVDNAPVNKQGIPVPGKFTYNNSGINEYVYFIRLAELYIPTAPGKCEEKELFLYAHAIVNNSDTKKPEDNSAWSEGTEFGTSRWGTYSTYLTCCKTGGGGCFPHSAYGGGFEGEVGSGWYYYDTETGGNQPIYSDDKKVAGSVIYQNGTLTIDLAQGWQLNDDVDSPVKIQGFDDVPTSEPGSYEYQGISLNWQIDEHPYYVIYLDLDYCFAGPSN